MVMDKRNSPLDIETLIAAIRREAMARGDTEPFHEQTDVILRHEREMRPGSGAALPPPRVESLQDWMPCHGAAFLISAYRTLLLREPDPEGLRTFSRKMADGRLARWEVAGRLRLSAEGRARRVRVKGLWMGFALATGYRVPVLGPLLALAARLLCLPPYLQDHARDDRLIAQLLAAGH